MGWELNMALFKFHTAVARPSWGVQRDYFAYLAKSPARTWKNAIPNRTIEQTCDWIRRKKSKDKLPPILSHDDVCPAKPNKPFGPHGFEEKTVQTRDSNHGSSIGEIIWEWQLEKRGKSALGGKWWAKLEGRGGLEISLAVPNWGIHPCSYSNLCIV